MTLEEALELHKQGKLEEAKSIYQSLLLTDEDPQVLYYLGVTELQLGRLEQAIDAFQQTVFKHPNVATFHVALGKALLQAGQTTVAEEHFFQAVELEPSGSHLFLLGSVQLQLGDRDSAKRCWSMGVQCEAEHFELLLFLGSLCDEDEEEEKSLELWTQAHQVAPSHPQVLEVLARWYSRAAERVGEGDLALMKQHLGKALGYQKEAHLFHRYTEVLCALGEMEEAESSCLQAIKLDPKAVYFQTLVAIYKKAEKTLMSAYQKVEELGIEKEQMLHEFAAMVDKERQKSKLDASAVRTDEAE